MILIVKALSHAIVVEVPEPLDLLIFTAAITLLSIAFYLTKDQSKDIIGD
jgi:phosphate starvation-inducible membrane PsiE